MYKLIASDLDETLLKADGSISAENVMAIKAAVARGVKFVPTTGRNFQTVQRLLRKLDLEQQPNEYIISFNGGATVENAGNRVILSNGLTFDQAQRVFEVFAQFETADIHVYTLDDIYIYRILDDDREYMRTRHVSYHEMAELDFSIFTDQTVIKIIAMHPDRVVQVQMHDALKKALGNTINCTYSSGLYVEVNQAGVDKGRAVLALAASLGIKPAEVIAFGDNFNDLTMLKAAGTGVAVANGIPEIKAVADYVTTADYSTGVAEAINKLVLTGN